MTFQDLKEIADSYYTVSVEIEHRCFYTYNGIDDFIKAPIGFAENKKDFVKNKKVQIGFVENKNNEFYPLVNSNDYSVYTEYIGCVKHDNNNIKLYFKIKSKTICRKKKIHFTKVKKKKKREREGERKRNLISLEAEN